MPDYDPNNQIDAELLSYGMEECPCGDGEVPACVVCGEGLRTYRATDEHLHFKNELFHPLCLLLAVLREKGRKEA